MKITLSKLETKVDKAEIFLYYMHTCPALIHT